MHFSEVKVISKNALINVYIVTDFQKKSGLNFSTMNNLFQKILVVF